MVTLYPFPVSIVVSSHVFCIRYEKHKCNPQRSPKPATTRKKKKKVAAKFSSLRPVTREVNALGGGVVMNNILLSKAVIA